ncbi:hypothetical protein SXM_3169 [Shewanella xiamenensis]|nr:hypothetical protein SXM_3169 [Shewanella xiamenensis]
MTKMIWPLFIKKWEDARAATLNLAKYLTVKLMKISNVNHVMVNTVLWLILN